jgi:hypothetical protein
MPYKRRRTDAAFRAAWAEATELGTESLEHEATRRAYHGVEEPVIYKGTQCGAVTKYSDTLLIFLLKARKPHVYRDRAEDSSKPTTININIVNVDSEAPDAEPTPLTLHSTVEQLPEEDIETVAQSDT